MKCKNVNFVRHWNQDWLLLALMFQLLNLHFPALHNGFKTKRGCFYYKQQTIYEWSPWAIWDRARLHEIEASFWETWLRGVCERRFEKTCESSWRILSPPLQAPANNSFRGWYIYIRITIMSLFMCASRDLSYIQLLNPVHNFLLKKKTSESYFYKGCLINSLSPLQEKITFFSDCDFNLLHSNK